MSNDLAKLAAAGIICANTVRLVGKSQFERPVRLYDGCFLQDSALGAYSYVAPGTTLNAARAGRYCSIGDNAVLGPTQHPLDRLTTSAALYHDVFNQQDGGHSPAPAVLPVEVGNDVWMGARCAVMGGITIGDGAIVALGAVVTRNVPAYAVVAGVPARVLRFRFPEPTIARLQAFKWWRFDLSAIRRANIEVAWHQPDRALDQLERAESAGRIAPRPVQFVTVVA